MKLYAAFGLLILSFLSSCARNGDVSAFNDIAWEFEGNPSNVVQIVEKDGRLSCLLQIEKHGEKTRRLKAFVIHGCYLLANRDNSGALRCFTAAAQYPAREIGNLKYLGILNNELALLFAGEDMVKSNRHRRLATMYFASSRNDWFLDKIGSQSFSPAGYSEYDYFNRALYKNKLHFANRNESIAVLSSFLILCLVLMLIIFFRNKLKKGEEQYEEVVNAYDRHKKVSATWMKLLTSILESSHLTKDDRERFLEKLQSISNITEPSAQGRQLLEQTIDRQQRNVINRFKREFPEMTDNDYLFFCLNAAGFDAATISVLMDMPSKGAVYTRKTRLKDVIKESDIRDKELFLKSLM